MKNRISFMCTFMATLFFNSAYAQQVFKDVYIVKATNFRLRTDWKKVQFDLLIKGIAQTVNLAGTSVQCYLSKDTMIGNDVAAGGGVIKQSESGPLAPGETRLLTDLWFAYNNLDLAQYPYVVIELKLKDVGGVVVPNVKFNQIITKHGFPKKIDLTPVKFDAVNLDWRREEGGDFSFKIKNLGSDNADPSVATFTYFISNDDPTKTEILNIPTPVIPAGGTVQLRHKFPSGCITHDCFFKMKVDSGNAITETNESNNEASQRMGGQ